VRRWDNSKTRQQLDVGTLKKKSYKSSFVQRAYGQKTHLSDEPVSIPQERGPVGESRASPIASVAKGKNQRTWIIDVGWPKKPRHKGTLEPVLPKGDARAKGWERCGVSRERKKAEDDY